MKSVPDITFDYRPSRWLAVAIGVVAALSVLAIAFSGADWRIKAVLIVVALVYAVFASTNFWNVPMRRIAWHRAGHWSLQDSAGADRVAELRHATVRGAWIVLSLCHSDGVHVSVVLGPDNCDSDTRRRLRVRLSRGDDLSSVA